jgi:thiosulfate dehydrogenase [quinone] large subunit
MSKTDCSTCASRRSFLASSGVALAGIAAAPAFATLGGCSEESSSIPTLSAPITVSLRSLNISAAGSDSSFADSSYPYKIIVRHNGDSKYQAWSSYCNHEGCEVDYVGTGFDCPCHGATWNAQGVLKTGPATEGLLQFVVSVSGDNFTVSNP